MRRGLGNTWRGGAGRAAGYSVHNPRWHYRGVSAMQIQDCVNCRTKYPAIANTETGSEVPVTILTGISNLNLNLNLGKD
jgi:hypothetical protein